jgi:hypothetical protein
LRGVALDDEGLSGVREIEVTLKFGAGPDAPDFQTAVSFIKGFGLMGK